MGYSIFRLSRLSSLFAVIVFLMISHLSYAEEALAPIKTAEIISAHELAVRVFDKTQKYEEAAKLLEYARVSRILDDKPADLPQEKYLQILNDYAKILFHIPGRFLEAEPLLIKVTTQKLGFTQAHLMLADLYHRRNELTPNNQFVQKYTHHYQRYIDLLKSQSLRVLLPDRIVKAMYSSTSQSVCQFVATMSEKKLNYELDNFFNPETNVESLKRNTSGGFEGGEDSFTFSDFSAKAQESMRKSRVDIDNDGVAELRYSYTDGQSGCERNLFFEQLGNKKEVLTHKLLDQYYQTGYLCGTDHLSVLEYKQKRYLVEKRNLPSGAKGVSIFDVAKKDKFENVCALNFSVTLPYAVDTDCELDICRKLQSQIGFIIKEDGHAGVEKIIADRQALVFSPTVMTNPVLRKFSDSKYLYAVDLDNDGVQEIIARLWPSAETGITNYEFRVFKKSENQWQHYSLPLTDVQNTKIPESAWIFVAEYNNQNFIVSYGAFQSVLEGQSIDHYQLLVYRLEKNRLQQLGALRAQAK